MPEIPVTEMNGSNLLSHVKGEVQGSGTEYDPYQISSENEFPEDVKLEKCEMHLIFKGLHFQGFGVIDSKNISFIDCSFIGITLQRSVNLKLINCKTLNLSLMNGRESYFKGCQINIIHNFGSSGNIFEHCEIGNPQALKMDILGASEFHKIILYLMLFLIATLFPDIYFSIVYWNNYFSIIGISIVITILGLIYLSIKRGGKKYERRPNIIRNSWKSKLQENH